MNLNVNELIKVETLPKLYYQLEEIGKTIDKGLEGLEDIECTEENKQEVKKKRTDINNLNKIMEDKRKEIKKAILKDYEEFNQKYENEVKNKLTYANEFLTNKINEIESIQKQQKEEELREFAKEHIMNNHLEDIISFEDIGINITLSASLTSLKTEIYNFCVKTKADMDLIEMEEFKDEILLEYKNTHDFVSSKKIVLERHRKLEEINKQQKEVQLVIGKEGEIEEEVDEIVAPVEVEEKIKVQFTIEATKEQIKKLKLWLESEEISYE